MSNKPAPKQYDLPPPGPSNIIVRTPFPSPPPKNVEDQDKIHWFFWVVVAIVMAIPVSLVLASLVYGG